LINDDYKDSDGEMVMTNDDNDDDDDGGGNDINNDIK